MFGVVVPLGHERRQHLSDPFFMAILGHLADALTENGYDIMLSRVIPDADDWLERIVESGMLDGVLVIGQSNQFEALERVAAYYKPMVVWGSHKQGQRHCTVGVDNRQGGRLAGDCLIAAGRKRLAFVARDHALARDDLDLAIDGADQVRELGGHGPLGGAALGRDREEPARLRADRRAPALEEVSEHLLGRSMRGDPAGGTDPGAGGRVARGRIGFEGEAGALPAGEHAGAALDSNCHNHCRKPR